MLKGAGFQVDEIAILLETDNRSGFYYMRKYGLSVRLSYSNITTADLERLVYEICTENNELGEVFVRARLLDIGQRVQRNRVRNAIHATVGALIQPRRMARRVNCVLAPLPLLHLDNNHKLIMYNFLT